MKNYLLLSLLFVGVTAQAQSVLLTENFDYPAAAPLRDHGWNAHSAATTNPISTSTTGLTLGNTAYYGNAIGRAALVNNTGSDENKPFSSNVDSGSVYASFLLKTTGEINTDGSGYFFHFVEYSNPTTPVYTAVSTAHRARTYITTGSTPAKFRLGLTFNSATVPSAAGVDVTNDLDTSKTYLVVVKYTFVSGLDNDQVSLFVFEDGDSLLTEPATPTLGPFGGTAADLTFLQGIALRQFNAAQRVSIDGIYVRKAWDLQANTTSVADETFAQQLHIYPNPYSGGPLYISKPDQQSMEVTLVDLLGKTGFTGKTENGQLDLPAQKTGLYLLQIRQDNKIAFKRLVIR